MSNERDSFLNRESLSSPANVKVGFRFESHSIFRSDDIPRIRASLTAQLERTFSRNNKNVVFFENNPNDPNVDLFTKGFQKSGSVKKGFAYMSFSTGQGHEPNEEELEIFYKKIESFTNALPERIPPDFREFIYFWTVYGVLEKMLLRKYNIDLVFERGLVADEIRSEKLRARIRGLDDYKEYKVALEDETKRRDCQIASQLVDLICTTADKEKGTSIFVLLGLSHSNIVVHMPAQLQPSISVYLSPISGLPEAIKRLNAKLKADKKVSDKLWEEAFRAEQETMR